MELYSPERVSGPSGQEKPTRFASAQDTMRLRVAEFLNRGIVPLTVKRVKKLY